VEARTQGRYALFAPALRKLMPWRRASRNCGFESEAYDALIDEYERG